MESDLYEINTLVFAEDQILMAGSGDSLQKGIFTWQNIAEWFGMEISPENSEIMLF